MSTIIKQDPLAPVDPLEQPPPIAPKPAVPPVRELPLNLPRGLRQLRDVVPHHQGLWVPGQQVAVKHEIVRPPGLEQLHQESKAVKLE